MIRLIFNLLIITSGALIRGGTVAIRIGQDSRGDKQVVISAAGSGVKWDHDIETILTGSVGNMELSPKNVQWYLTRRFVDELRAKISCRAGEEELVLQVMQPAEQQK